MNYWSDAVGDNHVVAHFIGGAWDGKTYAIPSLPEWRIAALTRLNFEPLKKADALRHYDIAVYKRVSVFEGEAIYWLTRIEKGDE